MLCIITILETLSVKGQIMRKISFLSGIIFSFFCLSAHAENFTLRSPDLGGQLSSKEMLNGFGCSGGNTSPTLTWSGAPVGTKSFAVTMYDPDASTGSGWWHWLIFDIPSDVQALNSNAGDPMSELAPVGSIQSKTDFGQGGYGGACPPPGDSAHAYIFTVYALKVDKLDLPASINPAMVGFKLSTNTLAKASLISYLGRQE